MEINVQYTWMACYGFQSGQCVQTFSVVELSEINVLLQDARVNLDP